jgi:hypothetical protein
MRGQGDIRGPLGDIVTASARNSRPIGRFVRESDASFTVRDANAMDKQRFRQVADAFMNAEAGLRRVCEAFRRVIRGFDLEVGQFGPR